MISRTCSFSCTYILCLCLGIPFRHSPVDLRGECEGQRGGDDEDQGVQAARQRDVQQEVLKVGLEKLT